MGYQNQGSYSLISMTNKDVYYIDSQTAQLISDMLERKQPLRFVTFVDTKSGATITINAINISSIVVKGGSDV